MANQTDTEHDPFSDAGEGDPFADAPEGQVEAQAEAGGEIPTVDREGDPIPSQPVTSAEVPDATPQASEVPEEAPPAPETPQAAPSAPESDGGDAPSTEGGRRQRGTSPLRHYKILFQTSETGWDEVKLDPKNTPDGVSIVKDEDTMWIEARNNEHAMRVGYVLLGSPNEGATILPIPQGGWKAKRVRKAPPRPERERLEIG